MGPDDNTTGGLDYPCDGTAGTASADGASEAQLHEGYTVLHEHIDNRGRMLSDILGMFTGGPGPDSDGGFLDRPHGWER